MNTASALDNPLLDTDGYKFTMSEQYPPNTEYIFSYLESRGGKFDELVFFGLQPLLINVMTKPITQEMVDEADEFVNQYIGPGIFNKAGFEDIVNNHNGMLPLLIKAVPEGTVIGTKQVLLIIQNTVKGFGGWYHILNQ